MSSAFDTFCKRLAIEKHELERHDAAFDYIAKSIAREPERKRKFGRFLKSLANFESLGRLMRERAAALKKEPPHHVDARRFSALNDLHSRIKTAAGDGSLTSEEAAKLEVRLNNLFSSKGVRAAAGRITAVPLPKVGGPLQ